MKRAEYLELATLYFRGTIEAGTILSALEERVSANVGTIPLDIGEKVILITNHPRADGEMSIPAELIAGMKGGNTRNFPSHWFPAVRQMMLRRAMSYRRFMTIGFDIGWPVAMQELGHLLIEATGSGRTQDIVSRMKGEDSSLVIFPEGGARDLQVFRRGFFYIAWELDIRKLAIGVFSPVLSLEGENTLKIISVRDIGPCIDSVHDFVGEQRDVIARCLGI